MVSSCHAVKMKADAPVGSRKDLSVVIINIGCEHNETISISVNAKEVEFTKSLYELCACPIENRKSNLDF
jgi:hypothetical protein